MSATTAFYVTPSTSLVLIKNLSTTNVVYLSNFNVPSFSVTVRDTTGRSAIQSNPVVLSTTGLAKFADGSSSYLLNQPYGLVNVSLRTPASWQINHTSGQVPSTAAANVGALSTITSFIDYFSSAQKYISTYAVENLTTPNSISIANPFLFSTLSTFGNVLFEGKLNVYGDVLLQNTLYVSGVTRLLSSIYATDTQPLSSPVYVLSSMNVTGDVFVGEDIFIKSTLTLHSTIQVQTLQVTRSTVENVALLTDSLQVGGLVSTLGSLRVDGDTTIGNNLTLTKQVSTSGGLFSTLNLYVHDDVSILQNLSSIADTSFASSFQTLQSLTTKNTLSLASTIGITGTLYTSSFSTLSFSTLGSFSTLQLVLLSTVNIAGNLSTSYFQTYQYLSIGGNVATLGTISSLSTLHVKGDVAAIRDSILGSAHTSSSVGVGGNLSVYGSTFASHVTIQEGLKSKSLETQGYTNIEGDVGVGNNVYIDGTLRVIGPSHISSFIVNSFLLSNLQIMTSSPFTSFQVSSLHASTLQTDFTRISTLQPDSMTVSSTYASTTQFQTAITQNAIFNSVYTDSLFVGNYESLAKTSQPKFVVGVKSQFLEGLSSIDVRTDRLEASGIINGNPVGNVSYLSNVPMVFPTVSAISVYLSTLTLSSLYTSSFSVSTLVNDNLLDVYSTVITQYLVLESQGFEPRYDVNQFLNINPTLLSLNRSLYFDRLTNRIGLFVSSPTVDMDISGYIYASNIYYSSINPIRISSEGTVLFSTILVSSSHIEDSLQYGAQGIRVFSQNSLNGNTYVEINQAVSSFSNTFGIYDCIEQSSILLNSAVQIYRNQRVGINGVNPTTGELVLARHDLDVFDTIRTDEVYVSTVNLSQSLQTTSYVTPYLLINCNVPLPINTLSVSVDKLSIDGLMTLRTSQLPTSRYVGINTLNPQCSMDVRGNAYFSSMNVFQNLLTNNVAMSFQQL